MVQVLDADTLDRLSDRSLPTGTGTSRLRASPKGRGEVYSISRRTCSNDCIAIERFDPPESPVVDAGYRNVLTGQTTSVLPKAVHVSPPGEGSSQKPDTAWVSIENGTSGGRL